MIVSLPVIGECRWGGGAGGGPLSVQVLSGWWAATYGGYREARASLFLLGIEPVSWWQSKKDAIPSAKCGMKMAERGWDESASSIRSSFVSRWWQIKSLVEWNLRGGVIRNGVGVVNWKKQFTQSWYFHLFSTLYFRRFSIFCQMWRRACRSLL